MIGVSTACLYPEQTEESLRYLAENGVQTVEVFFNTFSEFSKEYALQLKKLCDQYHVHIYSVHPFTSFMETYLFFDEYARRKKDGFRLYRSFFEVAQMLGAQVFNFHGQALDRPDDFEKYVQIYSDLFRMAKEYDLIFSQENVRNYKSRSIEFVSNMANTLQNEVAFTFDIKQAHMAGEDLLSMAKAMAERLVLVHINDYNDSQSCLLPTYGNCDLAAIKQTLSQYQYTGPYMIEVYSSNYQQRNEILNSKNRLEKIFGER